MTFVVTCVCGCGEVFPNGNPRRRFFNNACAVRAKRGQQFNPEGRRVIPDEVQYERRVVRNEHGCWGWTGGILPNGYAFWRSGRRGSRRTIYAHRYSLEQHLGRPIAPGMEVDHVAPRCTSRSCSLPDHLEEVTHEENNRRSSSRSAVLARQTSCKNGHDFTEANTYLATDGSRHCRQCMASYARRRRAAQSSSVD